MDFDGGDSERKARAVLEQLIALKLAKKIQVTISAQGGRGQVYFAAELALLSIVPMVDHHSEGAEVPEASTGGSGIFPPKCSEAFTADVNDDYCPF